MEGGQTNEFRPLILVAEDDDSNFKLIKAIIGKKCDIQWAKNGEEIVALFKEYGKEAKAILMDIKIPLVVRFRQGFFGQSDPDGHQNACDERTGCYKDYSRGKQGNSYHHADCLCFQL